MAYCGPTRTARASELLAYQRKGWRLQPKADGWYAELRVGRCPCCGGSALTLARYRSGRVATLAEAKRSREHALRDVLGLHVSGWPSGTVLVGESHVGTPAARRREDALGLRGVTLFDVLAVGFGDELPTAVLAIAQATCGALPARDLRGEPQSERRRTLEELYLRLEGGPARRAIDVVPEWSTGLRNRYAEIVEGGGEGGVLVDPSAPVGKGKLKVKRRDTVGCRVVSVSAEQGTARLSLGGMTAFSVQIPAFPIAPGQAVDVAAVGFYDDSWTPRHARIVAVRPDLG